MTPCWQCEAERCYRQRDRAGRWHAHRRDMGETDPGPGNRYHPECRPAPTLGLCADSPTGRHEPHPERWGDTVCVWCLEDTPPMA